MKLLFDEMMPEELAPLRIGHEVRHAIDLGWRHIGNGKLLTLGEDSGFDVLVTKDSNIPYQQNLAGRQIAVLLLRPKDQSLPTLLSLAPAILLTLPNLKTGSVTILP